MKRVILLNIDIELLGDRERKLRLVGEVLQRFLMPVSGVFVCPKKTHIGLKQQIVCWTKHQFGMHGVGVGGGGVGCGPAGSSSFGDSGSGIGRGGISCGGGGAGGMYLKA